MFFFSRLFVGAVVEGEAIHAGDRVSFIAQSTLVAALLCWCSLLRVRADVEAVREGDGRRLDARHHGPLLSNTRAPDQFEEQAALSVGSA